MLADEVVLAAVDAAESGDVLEDFVLAFFDPLLPQAAAPNESTIEVRTAVSRQWLIDVSFR